MTQKEPTQSATREWNIKRTDPYDGFLYRTYADAVEIAASKGCVVRSPASNELFIDIDSHEAMDRFHRLFATFCVHEAADYEADPSPSGTPGRYHVVVFLRRDVVDMRERIMLQACLGSDPMRELLSWRRLQDGADHDAISLFFEKVTR